MRTAFALTILFGSFLYAYTSQDDLSLNTVIQVGPPAVRFSQMAGENRHAEVEISLTNISGRIVTAYTVSVTAYYADGTTRMESTARDEVNNLLQNGRMFSNRATRKIPVAFPLDAAGNPPVRAETKLEAAVFDDLTALGDPAEIRRRAALRRAMAQRMTKTLDNIQQARRTPDPKAALNALITDKQKKALRRNSTEPAI